MVRANHNHSKIQNHREKPKRAGAAILGGTLDSALNRERRQAFSETTALCKTFKVGKQSSPLSAEKSEARG